MIYTRMGSHITLTASVQLDIPSPDYWFKDNPDNPTLYDVWFFKAVYVDDGLPLFNGDWSDGSALIADGAWPEIEAELKAKQVDASTVAEDIGRSLRREWRRCGEKKRAARFEAMQLAAAA